MSNNKLVSYKGYKLPREAVEDIRAASKIWRDRDKTSWEFAEIAAKIVGKYIPDATLALTRSMNVTNPSTPQGYAKAWNLALDLDKAKINHHAPLANLFIGHYITVGKTYNAGNISLEEADKLLKEASKFDKPVDWVRSKLSGKTADNDSWINSARMEIDNIERHIINTSYLGVDESKATLAAKVGKVFIKVLRWAIGEEQSNPLEQHNSNPNWDRVTEAIMSVIHLQEDEYFRK